MSHTKTINTSKIENTYDYSDNSLLQICKS